MKTKLVNAGLGLAVLAGFTGCAHYSANTPKTADRADGYYYHQHQRKNNSDDILLLLAFSGGGTRAASFSYGLLEALRDVTFEVEGKQRRLLDEVDVISSVSGGSVTAATYCLHGDRIFDVFEPAFLKRNIDRALGLRLFNPLFWPELWSSTYGRSDMAAKYYDKILFQNARFQDLATNNSPYLVLNGTDIATGVRLSFTQHFFDVLASDLETYPVSRAVAASSAVPGVLTPITLNNYSGRHPVSPPVWARKKYGPDAGQAGRQATALSVFLDGTNYPYLHVVDGGVTGNLGLRIYLDALSFLESNPESTGRALPENVRKVIFISANAAVHKERAWDAKSRSPGSIPVVMAAEARMVEHYSADTLAWFREGVDKLRRRPDLKGKVDFYTINLDFKQFADPAQAAYFLSLPTTFSLSDDVVDKLKAAAHTLLHQNVDFQRLKADLQAGRAGAAATARTGRDVQRLH
jgi:NTE family protein